MSERSEVNRGLIVASAAAVLVLAALGGTAGYLLAGDTGVPASSESPSPPATSGVPPSAPATTSGPSPTAGRTTTANGFALPNVSNMDFEKARTTLLDLRLGVTLVFGQGGDDRSVSRTEPAAGQTVRRGITVKVFVRGGAPFATVPGVVNLPCNQAGSLVVSHGLFPEYPTGRAGVVLRMDPEPGGDKARWNDRVKLFCGTPTPTATSG